MEKYIQIKNGNVLPDIKEYKPFRAIVIIESKVSNELQQEISKWLVESGCLYMMAWGNDCESWDTSVDEANLNQWENEEIPNEAFVLTTWHAGETIEEVFWYAKHSAFHHSDVDIENTLLIHLSSIDKEQEFLIELQAA